MERLLETTDGPSLPGPVLGAPLLGGGKVLAIGTPEEVAEVEGSWTGRHLKGMLAKAAPKTHLTS